MNKFLSRAIASALALTSTAMYLPMEPFSKAYAESSNTIDFEAAQIALYARGGALLNEKEVTIGGGAYSGKAASYTGNDEKFRISGVNSLGVRNNECELPDYVEFINNAEPYDFEFKGDKVISDSDIDLGKSSVYARGDLSVTHASFSGSGRVAASGDVDISFGNDDALTQAMIMSEDGGITIDAANLDFSGLIYAPNGKVKINAKNLALVGGIYADSIEINGTSVKVTYADFFKISCKAHTESKVVAGRSEEVTLNGSVSIDKADVEYTVSPAQAEYVTITDEDTLAPKLAFSKSGEYDITLTARLGGKKATDTVKVVVTDGPVVTYTSTEDFEAGTLGSMTGTGDELKLEAASAKASSDEKTYSLGGESGVSVKAAQDKGAVSTTGDELGLSYSLEGYGKLVTGSGNDVVLCIDNSGSVREMIPTIKAAAQQIIESMGPNDRLGITSLDRLNTPLTSDKDVLVAAIEKYDLGGGSDYGNGLRIVNEQMFDEESTERDKFIFLLADGENGWTYANDDEIALEQAEIFRQNGTKVYTFEINPFSYDFTDTSTVQDVAINTNGAYKLCPDAETVGKFLLNMADAVYNIAARNVTFSTTVVNGDWVKNGELKKAPDSTVYNEDGSVTLSWNYNTFEIDETDKIGLALKTGLITDRGYIQVTRDTKLISYDSNGEGSVLYLDDIAVAGSSCADEGSWTSKTFDSEMNGCPWSYVMWNTDIFGNSDISVYLSTSEDGKSFSDRTEVTNGQDIKLKGRYLRAEVEMKASSDGSSPVLYDLTVYSDKPESSDIRRGADVSIHGAHTVTAGAPVTLWLDIAGKYAPVSDIAWSAEGGKLLSDDTDPLRRVYSFDKEGDYPVKVTVDADGVRTEASVVVSVLAKETLWKEIEKQDAHKAVKMSLTDVPAYVTQYKEPLTFNIKFDDPEQVSWVRALYANTTAFGEGVYRIAQIDEANGYLVTVPIPSNNLAETTIVVDAFDWYGNKVTESRTVKLDRQAPKASLKTDKSWVYPNAAATLTATYEDDDKVASVVFTCNGEEQKLSGENTFAFSNKTPGTYNFELKVTDVAGNVTTASAVVTVREDSGLPVVRVSGNNRTIIGNSTELTVTAYDNETGLAKLVLAIQKLDENGEPDGEAKTVLSLDNSKGAIEKEHKYTFTPDSIGRYAITATATDAEGNVNTSTLNETVVADTNAPSIKIELDRNEVIAGADANVTVTVTDDVAVADVKFFVGEDEAKLDAEGRFHYVSDDSALDKNGVKYITFKVVAKDTSGNERTGTAKLKVSADDKTAPSVSLGGSSRFECGSDKAYVTVTASDNIGVTALNVTVNGKAVTLDEQGRVAIDTSAPAEFTISAAASDAAGNTKTAEKAVTVSDTTKPSIKISTDKSSYATGESPVITATITDNHKLRATSAELDGKALSLTEVGSFTYTITEAAAGTYVLTVNAEDASGNVQTVTQKITVKDTVAPTVRATSAKEEYKRSETPQIKLEYSDNVAVTKITAKIGNTDLPYDMEKGEFTYPEDIAAGPQKVTVTAYDAAGNRSETVTVEFTIAETDDIECPVIEEVAIVPEVVHLGDIVTVSVKATDDSGEVKVTVKKDGTELAEGTPAGTFSFEADKAGEVTITVKAEDPSGNYAEQETKITVIETDTVAPVVNIVLDKDTYFENDDVVIKVEATDNVGVVSTVLTVDGKEAVLSENNTYTISKASVKKYEVSAKAYDAENNEGSANADVVVNEVKAPEITVTFDKEVYNEGDALEGLVTVQGQCEITTLVVTANGKPLTVEDGVFRVDELKAGEYVFSFTAEDAREKTSTVKKTINVLDEKHRVDERLYAVVDGVVKYGDTAVYKVMASDDIDKTTIGVTLNGSKIALTSELTYEFKGEKFFDNEFVLTAKTKTGEQLTVTNTVYVYETDKPALDVKLSKSSNIQEHDDIVITVKAEDASGIKKIMCLFDGAEMPLDENGQIFLNDFDMEPHAMIFRAWDNFNNLSSKLLTFYLVETEVEGGSSVSVGDGEEKETKDLTAKIIIPTDGSAVSCPTFVIGNAGGTEFEKYKLEYQSTSGGDYTLIEEGNKSVNGQSLGEFDTTMLRNGLYNIRLTVWGKNGATLTDEKVVSVEGEMKIGNFSLNFQDMSLNVAGIPVTVVRGYDTRDRNAVGDFGYGWSLSTVGANVSKSCDLSQDWEKSGTTSATYSSGKPHYVSVNWGDGKTEKFAMKVKSEGWASHSPVSVSFESMDKNGSKLTTNYDGYEWYYESGQIYTLGSDWDEVYYDPIFYTLTRRDGSVFTFHKDRGLTKYVDPNGNVLDLYTNAVVGDNSESSAIVYNQDSQKRITSIVSPSKKTVAYEYDDNGDLVKVTDEAGYETKFEYTEHYLTAIIDPRGVTVSRNVYDDDGRLVKTIDADGNETTYEHDIDGREETITDRNGGVTRFIYDWKGNVLAQTDPNGNTVRNTYDSNGKLATKTDAMGNVTKYSYDESGNMLGLTDAEGHTVTNTYDAKGMISSINAMGIDIMKVTYDDKGNATSTVDALGNAINYAYDAKGNVTSVTDEIGTYTTVTYDKQGNVVSSTNGAGTTAEFAYDENGNCISKTLTYTSDGTAKTVTEHYTYDASGNLVKIVDSSGNVTSTEYNSIGKIAVATDEKNRQTTYTYDDFGNLTKIKYADGTSESFTYDKEGNNLTATDRLGRIVSMKYDKVGNLLSKTYPNGAVTTYTYDANYNLVSTVSASGAETRYEYDKIGRNTAIVDALGNRTTFTYNEQSQLGSVTDAKGNTYTYGYDANGNKTSITYPDGSSASSAYDARGRLISQTDQHGNTTSYAYDDADRLTGVTDALGSTTSYTYDEVGDLIKVTDANGNSTLYTYDDLARVVKVTNALGKTAEVTYDVCGNILTSTDFGGNKTTYSYDEYDRVSSKKTADGTVTYAYTEDGKLSSVTDGSGTTKYTYNDMDGLSKVEYPNGSYVSYTYDDTNRLTGISTALGTTSYEFDKLDRLVRVVDRNGVATLYEYDENGNRSAVRYANGIVVTYTYDDVNRLISEKALDNEGGLVAQYEYTLGDAGERTAVKELDRTVEYTYDALYRLTGEKITAGEAVTEFTYAYDKVSNRILKTENGAETTYTYNALNQLVSENDTAYVYDDAGNLLSVTDDAKSVLYAYNADNKMIRATVQEGNNVAVEEYEYDYAGNRTVKKSENDYTYYLNDVGGSLTQVLAELDADGNEKCCYTRGFEIISQERGDAVSYYLTDGHGSVRQLVDSTGAVTDTYDYDAWGTLLTSTGTTENSYLYCGEQLDSATGLYYLRARYMDPSTGTFTTMDTYQGSLFDPTSLHKYLYANANPVSNIDPSGYFSLAELNISQTIDSILDHKAELNYMKIYRSLKSKLDMINNVLTLYDMGRQIVMIINDPNLSGWQMVEGIACGVITSMFINHMCKIKAIGPIISKIMTGYGLVTQWKSIMDAAENKQWDLVATRSVQLILSLMSLHQNCFTGDTLVATEDGQKRIDKIEAGDKVWAYDIYTGKTELKEVLTVYVHDETEILHLHTTAGDVDTTSNHPFYVTGRGWVAAGDLNKGDEVYLMDGSTAFVTGAELEKLDEPVKVYNLEVADFHTYFVGDGAALVHNECKLIKNDDGSFDVELEYKEGWTPEQRAAADAKCKALSEADTVKTDVTGKRDGSKTARYRKDNAVPSSQDVDHTIDLQLGGIDDPSNMNGLDKSVNRSLGSQISHLIRNLAEGIVLGEFRMKDGT